MIRTLGERGYARLYLLAGPQMLPTVLRTDRSAAFT